MNLLLAAVFLVQDKTAEETFKKIEERILNAKSLSVKFEAQDGKENPEVSVTGSILMKAGNKLRFQYEWKQGGRTYDMLQVSDGSQFQNSKAGKVGETGPTPSGLNRKLLISLSRIGWLPTFALLLELQEMKDPPKNTTLEEQLVPSAFEVEKAEGDLMILKYSVSLLMDKGRPTEPRSVRIYYDPKTLNLIKRVVENQGRTFIEKYRDWVFGEDIPDEKFKLPEEKK